MKCNPWRWLWGLIPIWMLGWIAAHLEKEQIEGDLSRRASLALHQAGLDWATPGFTGRDGIVVGNASQEGEPARALSTIANMWGVRAVTGKIDLIDTVDAYVWSAVRKDGIIELGGFVPNEETRGAVLDLVKENFPGAAYTDRMRPARGAPERELWLRGVSFGLRQLASLKRGIAQLDGVNLSLAGEAEDSPAFRGIKLALINSLPTGIKLATDDVGPPLVRPYTWTARSAASQVTLSGHVPSERLREEIFVYAKNLFPRSAVVDRMETAGGAPDGWEKAARGGLDQLVHLREGAAAMHDSELSISGIADDESSATATLDTIRGNLQPSFKIAADIKFPRSEAAKREAEARQQAEEARRKAEEEEARRKAEEVEAQRQAQEARRIAEDEEAKRAAEAARRETEAEAEAKRTAEQAEARRQAEEAEERRRTEFAAHETKARAEADRCQQSMSQIADKGVIQFNRASADLSPQSLPTLDRLAEAASACPEASIAIEGHTDSDGPPERNMRLSDRRAQSVVDYLVKAGVDAGRLSAVGYGETRPVALNDTPQNRARNRRIEFAVRAN